jgi:hypothetical protein
VIGQRKLDDRQRELLAVITVGNDNIARFPKEPRIPDWPALKKVMVALGGTWKTSDGFRFPADVDADELIHQARSTGAIIDPRAADFFETPDALADEIVEELGLKDPGLLLEPSAGKGAIVRAMRRRFPGAFVFAVEPLAPNLRELYKLPWGTDDGIFEGDFLSLRPGGIGEYDGIAMNPPFSKRQDIAHVRHAFQFLAPGGALAAIMSGGVAFRDDRMNNDFRAFVADNGGSVTTLPDGSFKSSGTDVRTVLVKLRRIS